MKNMNIRLAEFQTDLAFWLHHFQECITDTPKSQNTLSTAAELMKDLEDSLPNNEFISDITRQMLNLTFVIYDNKEAFVEFIKQHANSPCNLK